MDRQDNFEEVGKNCLIANVDSLNILDQIDDKSVDMILTDPPYNIGKFMCDRNTNMGMLRKNHFSASNWDNLEHPEWLNNMEGFFSKAARIIKVGGSMK